MYLHRINHICTFPISSTYLMFFMIQIEKKYFYYYSFRSECYRYNIHKELKNNSDISIEL